MKKFLPILLFLITAIAHSKPASAQLQADPSGHLDKAFSIDRADRHDQLIPTETFVLIVTNNHSAELGRPELRYADDDGAKYYNVFRMLAPEDHVTLLTEFDRDSEKLFPQVAAKTLPPTKNNVLAATRKISDAVAIANRAEKRVDFYFVFAGHGDVDQGQGFLELRDGRLNSSDLESMLKSIPSTRSHVILDSCNSFFVLNPRKAGGQPVAVTEDAAKSLGNRLPNVGVLLSTSAEAEVFEWSELQSGIFSHAVVSGLSGAADANHDGYVSYDELHAFIEVSSAQVKNPLYRPKVFARGPGGRNGDAIVDLKSAEAKVVELDPSRPMRLTVRDNDELARIDVNKEAGAAMTLRVPIGWGTTASIEERDLTSANRNVARYSLKDAHEEGPVLLASLEKRDAVNDVRGTNEVLSGLFSAAFGPRAFAQWQVEVSQEPPPVYGVSNDDVERMRLLLAQVADIEHRGRVTSGAVGVTVGSAAILGGLTLADSDGHWDRADDLKLLPIVGCSVAAGGLFRTILGSLDLSQPSRGEKMYDEYIRMMAAPNADRARVMAATEIRLFKRADEYRKGRRTQRIWAIVLITMGTIAAGITPSFPNPVDRQVFAVEGGLLVLTGTESLVRSFNQSSVERMRDLWVNDPGYSRIPRVSLSLAPMGLGMGVVGTF